MRNRDLHFLLAVALVYRLVFLLLVPRVLDSADSVHYAETARLFAAGEFFAHNPKIPILYPLFGAFFTQFTGDAEWGCRFASFLFSTFTIVPVYGIALRLFDRRAAWWAGLAVALWPWLADYACAVSTEATAVFFWLSGFWALLVHRPVIAALLFFALHLTRAEGMLLALAALPALVIMGRPESSIEGKAVPHRAIPYRALLSYAIPLFLLLALGTLYNRALTGETDPNIRIGFILDEFDYIRFIQTAMDTLSDVVPVMLGPMMMLFIGIGLFAPDRSRPRLRGELALLFLCAVQLGASWMVLSPAPRYLMAPLIALSLWSAAGLVRLMNWTRNDFLRVLPAVALVAFHLMGAARTLGGEFLSDQPRQPVEYKEAGLWMREHLEPGMVFTRKPQVAYYAGMPSTGPLDTDTLDEALARAREAGAVYLVVDERYAPAGLRPLLEPEAAPAGVALLHRVDTHPRARVMVYELRR